MDRMIEQVADGFAFPGAVFRCRGDLYVTQCGGSWIARARRRGEVRLHRQGAQRRSLQRDNVLDRGGRTNQLLRDGAELVEIASACDGPCASPTTWSSRPMAPST